MPNLDFLIVGSGPVIVFLHGWGQNKEMMIPIMNKFKNKYTCVAIDMPGFGNSDFNDEKDIEEYVKNIHDFLIYKLHLTPSYIIGHSFGGKVAIEYYLKYGLKGIVLVASPVLKPKRNFKYYLKILTYKIKKKLRIKHNMGSIDYKNTTNEMKKFFVSVVNTHYNKKLSLIKIPTLLIYSKEDEKVNFKCAKILERKLLRVRLRVIKGDHFAYLTNREIVSMEINNFLKEREKHAYYL